MKHKKLIITLSIIFVVGLSCLFVGVVLKGATVVNFVFDKGYEFLTAEEPNMVTEYISNDTKVVDFDIDASSLKVISGDVFSINYDENRYSVEIDNNKISVSQISTTPMFQFGFDFNHKFDIGEIILTIPNSTVLNNLNLKIAANGLEINNITAENFDLDVSVGDADIKNCNFTNAKLVADVGDIDIDDSTFVDIQITSNLGDIKIDDTNIDNQIIANVDLGNVEIKETVIKKLADFDLNLGNLELDLIGNGEDYTIKGDVDLGEFEYNGNNYSQSFNISSTKNNENLIDIKIDSGNCELNFE